MLDMNRGTAGSLTATRGNRGDASVTDLGFRRKAHR